MGPIWLAALALGLAAPERTVPCSESIDGTRFPYAGYRLVLGAVSVPPAYHRQVLRNGEWPWWPHFFKAGLVVRATGQPVTVTVPRSWRRRAAIAWGYGGHGVFSSLRIAGCRALPTQGFAYSGGFYLSAPACLPLVFRAGGRSAVVRFGLGVRCR